MTKKVEHRPPTPSVQKQILTSCGNQCAFPGCSDIIVDREHGVLVGKIAHIKARRSEGARFDENQTEEENRSPANLLALCGKHHDIVDAREDIYTVDKLIEMKRIREEEVEGSADKNWIRPPNWQRIQIQGLESATVYFWMDRQGRARVYSDRQYVIAHIVQEIYLDLDRLCQLYKMAEDNPEAPASSLMQNIMKLNKASANLGDTEWTPIAHILVKMAEIPEVTFADLLTYLVEGGDATNLFVERARVLEEKIEKRRNPG